MRDVVSQCVTAYLTDKNTPCQGLFLQSKMTIKFEHMIRWQARREISDYATIMIAAPTSSTTAV